MSPTDPSVESRPKRGWARVFQYTLGSLFVLMTAVSFGLVWWMNKGPDVMALIRVQRGLSPSANDHRVYRETQASLLQSEFVIMAALRDSSVANTALARSKNASSIVRSRLRVETNPDSEIVVVQLPNSPDAVADQKLLNAILSAYVNTVVNAERMEVLQRGDQLRQKQALLERKIDELAESTRKDREDAVAERAMVEHRVSMLTAKCNRLNEQITEAEIKAATDDEVETSSTQQEQLKALRDALEKCRSDLFDVLRDQARLAVDVKGVVQDAELRRLQNEAASVSDDLAEVDAELNGTPRVQILQRAFVP